MSSIGQRLRGKVIAVAGGGGIGDELARRFAREGARVVLGDLDADRALTTAAAVRDAGGDTTGLALDGGDEASVNAFFAFAGADGLDGAHMNFASFADAGLPVDVLDTPLAVFDEVMRINARGFVLCTRAALPYLIARGQGAIVYTSSGAAHTPAANRVAYAMSKAATHALMRHVAQAFGGKGIRANVIAPGYILHERLRASAAPGLEARAIERNVLKDRAGEAFDIAALAALLMSEEGAMITGQVLSVDGGSSMRL
jgi:NAD(P)-dependent dehydrogenase (short-subunit alcohol dehydrogenase family)